MITRCVLAAVVVAAATVWAADPSVKTVEAEAPQELAEPIRSVLQARAIQVTTDDGLLGEFWFRTDFPVAEGVTSELEVEFTQIKMGTLVGVVKLGRAWSDYKDNNIEPGLYTLRFGIRPADGNHMGVSIYRDFVLLIPVAQDQELEMPWSKDDFAMQSFGATGIGHPAVMSIFPIWEEISEPSIVKNDMDQWTLAMPFDNLAFGLVVEGHGEH